MQLFKKRKTKQQVEEPVRQLELPNEVMQRLEMQDGQDAFVRIEGKSIRIEPVIKPKKEPRKHLLWLVGSVK
ncbi:hypothetical protein A4S06_07815 [Erysipelotrichaceae bacterium MTC7]|nr:hypothetical protein A4S06_07815 [Erysipelotrichaceae bacterium MTC7]